MHILPQEAATLFRDPQTYINCTDMFLHVEDLNHSGRHYYSSVEQALFWFFFCLCVRVFCYRHHIHSGRDSWTLTAEQVPRQKFIVTAIPQELVSMPASSKHDLLSLESGRRRLTTSRYLWVLQVQYRGRLENSLHSAQVLGTFLLRSCQSYSDSI